MARIIVVDDEPELRDMVREYLSQHGFEVRAASGGEELRRLLDEAPADLALLDVRMPGEDGLALARWLRERGGTAIVMLTSLDEVTDRIVGLEVGADDYLPKPFDLRELRARVRAVLRRTAPPSRPAAQPAARRVRFGRVWLDLDGRRLVGPDGGATKLTAMEFDLLSAFAERPGRVLSRDQLLDLAQGKESDPFDRSIDIRIARLRRKIEEDPTKPQTLKTVRGAGYVFLPGEPAV